jgi:hypothetical protein
LLVLLVLDMQTGVAPVQSPLSAQPVHALW